MMHVLRTVIIVQMNDMNSFSCEARLISLKRSQALICWYCWSFHKRATISQSREDIVEICEGGAELHGNMRRVQFHRFHNFHEASISFLGYIDRGRLLLLLDEILSFRHAIHLLPL